MLSIKEQVSISIRQIAINILNEKLTNLYDDLSYGRISYAEYEKSSTAIKRDIEYLS